MSYIIRLDEKLTVSEREKITKELNSKGIKAELITDYESLLRDEIDSILQIQESKILAEMPEDEYNTLVDSIANEIYKDDASILDEEFVKSRINEELKIQLEIELKM